MAKTKSLSMPNANGAFPLDHAQMHMAHRIWAQESAFWHDELKLWQDEVKRASDDLAKVKIALAHHQDTLREHGASLQLYQQEACAHEHDLANFEHGGSPTNLVKLTEFHQREEQHHNGVRRTHEKIKLRQHAFMTHYSLLLKTLGANSCDTCKNES